MPVNFNRKAAMVLLIIGLLLVSGCDTGVTKTQTTDITATRTTDIITRTTETASTTTSVTTEAYSSFSSTVKLTYTKTFLPPEEPAVNPPESEYWLSIMMPFPGEIEQPNFFQTIKEISFTYSVAPTLTENVVDEFGNVYEIAWWAEEQNTEVSATMEALIYREIDTEAVSTSDPYPMSSESITGDMQVYLQPYPDIQSDAPAIVEVAQSLHQGLTSETEVVNNTLAWCKQNLGWICPNTIDNYQPDAMWTMENGGGNCVNFANVMVALFRAQGIPARLAYGIKGYEHDNPGFLTPVESGPPDADWHVQTEVFFPEAGWVRYDATYFTHPCNIPYGIQFDVRPYYFAPDTTDKLMESFSCFPAGSDFSSQYQLIGMGN